MLSNHEMRACIFAVIALAACHKSDCASAVANSVGITAPKQGPDHASLLIKRTLTDACVADHWDQEMIDCLADAHADTEVRSCNAKLSKQQIDSRDKRLGDMMQEIAHQPAPPMP